MSAWVTVLALTRLEKTSAGMLTSVAPLSMMKFNLSVLLITTGAMRPPDIFTGGIRVSRGLLSINPSSVLICRTDFAELSVRPGLSRSASSTSERAVLGSRGLYASDFVDGGAFTGA